jgi:hypothetical protein
MVEKNYLRNNRFGEVKIIRDGKTLSHPFVTMKYGNREIHFLGLSAFDGTICTESEYGAEQIKLLYSGKPCVYTDSVADTVDGISWCEFLFFNRDGFTRKQTKRNIENLYGLKKGDVVVGFSIFQSIDGEKVDEDFFDAEYIVEEDKHFFKNFGYSKAFKTNFKGDSRADGLVSIFRKNGFNVKVEGDSIVPWRGVENEMNKFGIATCRYIDTAVAFFKNNHGQLARAHIFKDGVVVNSAENDWRYADIFFPMEDNTHALYEKIVNEKV